MRKMNMIKVAGAVVLASAAMPLWAQEPVASQTSVPQGSMPQGTAPQSASGDAQNPVSYVFGPHDVINIAVVGRTDFNQQVLVQDDGTISLALIGSVNVTGMTALQLKRSIEGRLRSGGYFLKPEVTVTLATATSQYAVVLGEIANPGLATLDRTYHLSELIARAGGVRAGADVVTVTMPGGEAREFSLRAIATNASPDPLIPPGTKVYVQQPKMYYVYGQVGSPGTYAIEPDMTVRMAIARAGGLSALGSSKKVKIFRADKEMKHVNLNEKMMPGDTIQVGERFF